MPRIIIAAIGNVLKGDDGVGSHIIKKMAKMILPRQVELVELGTSAFDLLSYDLAAEHLIIIDAIDIDAEPGTIHRLNIADIPIPSGNKVSMHEISVIDLLDAMNRPANVIIIGVQPDDIHSWSLQLSSAVAQAVPRVVEIVLAEVDRLLADREKQGDPDKVRRCCPDQDGK